MGEEIGLEDPEWYKIEQWMRGGKARFSAGVVGIFE